MMPVRIGLFRKSMESLYCDVTIRRFHEVSSGTWAPMEAVHSYLLNGQTATEVKLTVQMESSSWNLPVSDDVFALPFPVGTRVMDKTRDLAYITGKADAGKNVDTLLEGAHKVIGRKPVPPPELPTGWKRWRFPVLITANAVAATVFLALLWVRKRNRREATKG
jgi:hypothetical protein